MVDLAGHSPGPTWRNGHVGDAGISKRLDDFLSSSHLLPSLYFFRSWATPSGVSEHYPIFLEWGQRLVPQCYPFKFNKAWLLEDDFSPFFGSSWKAPLAIGHTNPLDSLTGKLGRLKGIIKGWERKKNCERKQFIMDINDEISNMLLMDSRILTADNANKMKELQDKKVIFWLMRLLHRDLREEFYG